MNPNHPKDKETKTPLTFADLSSKLAQAGWRLSATPGREGRLDGEFTATKGQPQTFKLIVSNLEAPSEKLQLGSDSEFAGAEKIDPAKLKPEDVIRSGYVKKDISLEEAAEFLTPKEGKSA